MRSIASLMVTVAVIASMTGCAGLNPGDSRSMSQKYEDCTFYIAGTPEAGDIFAQAQMIEHSGGDESDVATQTQTTETPVDVAIPTGTDAITALVGAGAEGITKGLKDGDVSEAEAAGAEVDPNCADGNCSDAK